MKINKGLLILTGIAILALLFVSLKKCTKDKQLVDVIVPEKNGYFNLPPVYTAKESVRDSIIIKYRTIENTDTIYKDSIIRTENPINKELASKYLKQQDSTARLKLYLKAIEEKEGTSVFDNEDLKLSISTKVRGELLDIKPTYTIKERTVQAVVPKQKEPVFTMYAGGEVIGTKEINKLGYKADIGLQNKKGNILTLGIDNSKNYYLGVKFKLFSIKR